MGHAYRPLLHRESVEWCCRCGKRRLLQAASREKRENVDAAADLVGNGRSSPRSEVANGDARATLIPAYISLYVSAEQSSDRPTTPETARPRSRTEGQRKPRRAGRVSVQDLIRADLLQPPVMLSQKYLGREVTARIESDGRVTFDGQSYGSLSVAAAMARVSVKGPPAPPRKYWQTNGWTFWHYRDEMGQLRELAELRSRFLEAPGAGARQA